MTYVVFGNTLSPVIGWRTRLGGLFILERVQVKKWNLSEAARRAKINTGTIQRIEQGENYEVIKLERYAAALGRPLEAWLKEMLLNEAKTEAIGVEELAGKKRKVVS